MIVAADLNRPVAGVGHGHRDARNTLVQRDVAGRGDDFARDDTGFTASAADRIVDRHQLSAVWKRRFYLDVGDHAGDAIHHLIGAQHMTASLHQFGDGAAIACAFDDEVGDQCDGFGNVELDATRHAIASDDGGHRDQQFVFLSRSQMHWSPINKTRREARPRAR